ncbi:hypothetical protein ACFSCZ_17735 [Siminovitchia sediminis]|uniref:Uncharacterized protein n=1 Tax=Siminovitchia sediminis TaxID=1274353 RepID=A0ABW4KQK1_9BACI
MPFPLVKKKESILSKNERKNSEVYCLLLGLEHDVEFLEKIPIEEQRYLLGRINYIKSYLKGERKVNSNE